MDAIHEFSTPSEPELRPVGDLLSGYSYLEPSDVAYAKVTPCFENGKGLVGADLEGPSFATTEITVLRPRTGTDGRFLAWLLQSDAFRRPAIASMTGAGGLKRVSEALMRDLPLPAPAIETQHATTDYLDHETAEIDALIADLEHTSRLFFERLTARRDAAFASARAKHPLRRLKTVASLRGGNGFPHAEQGHVDRELPFFKVGSLAGAENGVLRSSENTIDHETAARLGATTFAPGTCVMAKIGAALLLARTATLAVPSCIDNNMLGITPVGDMDPTYLRFALGSISIAPFALPGAVPSLDVGAFRDAAIPVPSLTEQRAIVERLNHETVTSDDAVADLTRAITLAKERRAALITAAVTGQIDVTATHRPAAEQLADDIKELS